MEKQGRLEILAQHAQKAKLPFGTPQRLAHWRALEVLERIGSADARQLLSALAAGEAGAHLTQAAQAALIRSQPQ